MNRTESRLQSLRAFAPVAIAGLVSGTLYLSSALAPLYLIPIQIAHGQGGRKRGAISAVSAAVLIAIAIAVRLAREGALTAATLGASIAPPLVFLGALVLVNAPFWARIPATYRVLAVAAACALAAIPAVSGLGRDDGFATFMESRLKAAMAPIKEQVGDQSYDDSALAAALDPKALAAMTMKVLVSSYGAFLVLILGGSLWIGNRAAGWRNQGGARTVPLSAYRVPYALVWAFLAAWSAVLAALLTHANVAVQAAAWNCALALSLPYAVQGVGIASSFFNRWKMPRFTRIAIAATAIVALVTPTAGVVVAVALPLLGVTEVWIPYRNPKGVGA